MIGEEIGWCIDTYARAKNFNSGINEGKSGVESDLLIAINGVFLLGISL